LLPTPVPEAHEKKEQHSPMFASQSALTVQKSPSLP
jgi:hypothetical protein